MQIEKNITTQDTYSFQPFKLSVFSSIAHFLADFAIYPIDTLATRIKVNTKTHNNMFQEMVEIKKTQGLSVLYKGISSTIYTSFIPSFMYFYVYENSQYYGYNYLNSLNQNSIFNKGIQATLPFFVSGFSEFISLFFYLPFDIVRTRMQINQPQYQYKSILDGLTQIKKSEGFIRLYQASHIYIVVSTLTASFQFQAYEPMRKYFLQQQQIDNPEQTQQSLNIRNNIIVSLASTSVATFLVNPLDLILTRYQIIDSNIKKLSATNIVTNLVKKEGYKALFKGLGARMVYMGAYNILWLPVYDYCKGKYGVQVEI